MKNITRLSLALIIFSLFSIPYFVAYAEEMTTITPDYDGDNPGSMHDPSMPLRSSRGTGDEEVPSLSNNEKRDIICGQLAEAHAYKSWKDPIESGGVRFDSAKDHTACMEGGWKGQGHYGDHGGSRMGVERWWTNLYRTDGETVSCAEHANFYDSMSQDEEDISEKYGMNEGWCWLDYYTQPMPRRSDGSLIYEATETDDYTAPMPRRSDGSLIYEQTETAE